jgi:teichuronic acid biosynthesis glycosyltransferase TuaC
MRVLFISSGNSKNGISPLVKKQGETLQKAGVDVKFFKIKGKGVQGYFRNIFIFRTFLKKNQCDIIHAHYSLSAFVASIAGARPLVVSLMGSDVHSRYYYVFLNKFFRRFFWDSCIVKSEGMKAASKIHDSAVIPNGIDLSTYYFISKEEARQKLGLDKEKMFILFASDPTREEKNISLLNLAIEEFENKVELLIVNDKTQEELNLYYNAVDVVLLTSHHEGSPNIVKEAMVCNSPVVSTDVGDVRLLFGGKPGHFITSFDPADVAEKIKFALEFREKHGQTNGRERIIELGLDSETVAGKIIEIYNKVLKAQDQSVI